MCGIVGYVGQKEVVPVIIDGLRRLEYRGYDSAGIAVAGNGDGLQVRRAEGKLRNLEEVIRLKPLEGSYGIGHTRWATHGRPTEENAHPHRDCTGKIVVVHNGIVENYMPLKKKLMEELAEGQLRRGIVRNVTDFGAFVDLGGVDGLLHVSEMSHRRGRHPSEFVKTGEFKAN